MTDAAAPEHQCSDSLTVLRGGEIRIVPTHWLAEGRDKPKKPETMTQERAKDLAQLILYCYQQWKRQ
jgi:hypothetical protein